MSRNGMAAVIRSAEGISLGLLLGRLLLIAFRAIDLDEYEHAHAAWSVAQGLLPYRDFFEHHPPALYLLFAPIFSGSRTAIDPVHALRAIEAARGAMWLFAIASVALVYRLANALHDRLAAATAAFLLVTATQFLMSTLEFRPDVPAVFLLLVSIALLVDRPPGRLPTARGWRLVLAGVAFGAALLFTQKVMFAAPGIGLALLLTRRLRPGIVFLAGAVAPMAITLLWFRHHGALAPLWYYTVTINSRLNADGFSPWPRLLSNLIQQPAIYLLGLGALILTIEADISALVAGSRWRAESPAPHRFVFSSPHPAIIVLPALSLTAGIFIIGRSYDQYYALLLPFLAILGGALAVDLLTALRARCRIDVGPPFQGGQCGLKARTCATLQPALRKRPAFVVGALMAAALGIHLVTFLRAAKPIGPQVEELTYATTNLNPTDSYLGGSPGAALFRPHTWFYFFLTGAFPGDRDWAELTDAMQSGRLRPRIVIRDRYLEERAPAPLLAYIDAHYQQTMGEIYLRQSE